MRVSLVTGAAVGIGFAIAERLAVQGDTVILIDVDPDALDRAVAKLRARSLAAAGFKLDLLAADIEAAVAKALDLTSVGWLGLVNCASTRTRATMESETRDDWMDQLQLSTWAPFALSRFVVSQALERGIGAGVVNITSPLARLAGDHSPGYHAAKAALESTTRYLAVHAPRLGAKVTVNAVEPGLIVQDRHRERFDDGVSKNWRRICEDYLPLGVVGNERDIADAVAWLLSPEASFVNGATIVIDGGGTVQDQLLLSRIWDLPRSVD